MRTYARILKLLSFACRVSSGDGDNYGNEAQREKGRLEFLRFDEDRTIHSYQISYWPVVR